MDTKAQPQQQRIQQLAAKPDKTRDRVIESLMVAWHAQNDRRKALWDAQVLTDQRLDNGPNAHGAEQGDPARANEDRDAARRPTLGAFPWDTRIGNEVTPKPSAFAINKLRDMKYVELYCFTPAGCRDHASHITTITPDENLTWEQVRDARACFLSHITYVRWDQVHVNALALFFIKLDNHPFIQTSEGKQALVWYQAHARDDWHRKLGTPESFNIAILNDTLLASFKNKADDAAVQDNLALVSTSSLRAHATS